ncbi:MAG TPA: glycosyltransferase family 39 protein, partial [Patescibacteria group bacterium]|nr:glycosyltransferase family 39 protein [Patescibacteria group bacterium]
YFLGSTLARRRSVGLFSAFLAALSPYLLFTSMDARMYQPLLFFGLLSFYFFWQYLQTPKKVYLVFYILATVAALYTHLTAIFIIITEAAYWLFHYFYLKQKNISWRKWLLTELIIILAFLPWLISFIVHNLARLNKGAWYLNTSGGGFFLFELPRCYFFLGKENPFLELLALLFFGLLFLSVFLRLSGWSPQKKELKLNFRFEPAAIFALLIFAVPLVLGFCLQVWVSKYYILGSAGLFILLGMGFGQLSASARVKKIFLVCLLFLLLPYNAVIIKTQGHHQWDKTAAYIESIGLPGDIILFPAFVYELPFNQYYHGQLPISNVLTKKLEQDPLLLAIKYNWYPVSVRGNLGDINQEFKNNQRVILIYPPISSKIHQADMVVQWFVNSDWRLVEKKEFSGFEGATVYIFKNPAF